MSTSKQETRSKAHLLVVSMMIGMFLLPVSAMADAGKIIFLIGEAFVDTQDSGTVKATKGLVLNAGDTIRTSAKGQLQIRMDDGGMIAVRPGSSFRIDEFVNNKDINTDKSFFSLIKGGFRSVTGAIGEKNKAAYKVNTPIATIGIRGTDYTARLCDSDCNTDDGLYVGVLSGGVTVSNDAGDVDLDPTDYGYVESTVSEPVLLDEAPGDVLFAQTTTTEESLNEESTETSPVLAGPASDPRGTGNPPNKDPIIPPTTVETTEPTPPTIYQKLLAGGIGLDDGLHTLTIESVTRSADGGLEAVNLSSASGSVTYAKDANVASVDMGSTSNGEFTWGRWTSMNMTVTTDSGTVEESLTDANSVHWAMSNEYENELVLPKSGTATYQIVGGTSPTDNFGSTGTLLNAASSLNIDFSSQTGTFTAKVHDLLDPDDSFVSYRWQLDYDVNVASNGTLSGSLTDATTPDVGFEHLSYDPMLDVKSGSLTGALGGGDSTGSTPTAALVSYDANVNYTSIYTGSAVDYQIRGIAAGEL